MLEAEGPVIPLPPSDKIMSVAVIDGGHVDVAGVGVSECERPKVVAAATLESKMPVNGKVREKKQKQKKRVMVVDTMTRPFPVLIEEQLAWIKDPMVREEWRELMTRAAKHYYELREERAALGYA